MSNKQPKQEFESSIERYNKRLTIEMGSRAVLFDYENTSLYQHAEDYRQFDHVFRVKDGGEGGIYYLRDSYEELWNALVEHDFPRIVSCFPSENDERAIMTYFDQSIQKELEELLEGEDD